MVVIATLVICLSHKYCMSHAYRMLIACRGCGGRARRSCLVVICFMCVCVLTAGLPLERSLERLPAHRRRPGVLLCMVTLSGYSDVTLEMYSRMLGCVTSDGYFEQFTSSIS